MVAAVLAGRIYRGAALHQQPVLTPPLDVVPTRFQSGLLEGIRFGEACRTVEALVAELAAADESLACPEGGRIIDREWFQGRRRGLALIVAERDV